ncbi:Fc.00g048720.m01.CDS01 [Cosmosporella sp. VM-42]
MSEKRKLDGSRKSVREFHSRISPVIAGTHARSFYHDPRDNIPSDLRDHDGSAGAGHCCDRCQLMTGTVEGLRSLVSPEGHQHFTCNQEDNSSVRDLLPIGHENGVIRVWGISEDGNATDEHPFRPGPRLKALKVRVPLDPLRAPGCDLRHNHELGVLAFQGWLVLTSKSDISAGRLTESPDAPYVVGRRPDKTLTPDLIQQLRKWLDDCQDGHAGHESCLRRSSPELPTRVVDIAATMALPFTYVLTRTGLVDNPTIVPKTLSDAIKVCRMIGITYIWIDALCIAQDDQQDKATEIYQMGKIYKDATLTIMAASAKSVYSGFLDDTKVDAPVVKLPFHLGQDSFGAVFVRNSFTSRPYFLNEELIFKRAWTLQEMLLAAKQSFGQLWPPPRLYPQSHLSSILGSQYSTLEEFHLETLAKKYLEQSSVLRAQDAKGFDINNGQFSTRCQVWTAVIAEYSRRDLAVLDDRYPALAGITEELQKYAGKKWERRLGGPSWSWMSHPSSVSIDPVAVTDVEVLACETELAFPNQPFGPVKLGSLVLEARTLPLSALRTKVRIRPNVDPIWKRACAIMPAAMDGIALDSPARGLPEGELKAMALGMTFSARDEFCVTFLVLRRLKGDTYERIGQAVLQTAFNDEAEAIMKQAEKEVVVIE